MRCASSFDSVVLVRIDSPVKLEPAELPQIGGCQPLSRQSEVVFTRLISFIVAVDDERGSFSDARRLV